MARSIDWDYWRHRFVTGGMTLKALSEVADAPAFKTLRNRSSSEDWPAQRERYRDMARTQAAAVVPDVAAVTQEARRIIDAAEMLTQHNQVAKLLLSLGVQALRSRDPAEVSDRDALAMLRAGVEIQRLTEGLATERQATDGAMEVRITRRIIDADRPDA
jgi:hypothetical protein